MTLKCTIHYLAFFHFFFSEVKPELGQVPNSSGLANNFNPMKTPGATNTSNKGSNKVAEDDKNKKQKKKNTKKAPEEKKVVLVKGIFKIDPRLTFVPDWMYVIIMLLFLSRVVLSQL